MRKADGKMETCQEYVRYYIAVMDCIYRGLGKFLPLLMA